MLMFTLKLSYVVIHEWKEIKRTPPQFLCNCSQSLHMAVVWWGRPWISPTPNRFPLVFVENLLKLVDLFYPPSFNAESPSPSFQETSENRCDSHIFLLSRHLSRPRCFFPRRRELSNGRRRCHNNRLAGLSPGQLKVGMKVAPPGRRSPPPWETGTTKLATRFGSNPRMQLFFFCFFWGE